MMAADDFLVIGKISGAHGVNGNLRIYPYADDLSAIDIGSCLFIKRQADQQRREITVTGWRPHGRAFLLSCKEITSRSQAEEESGGELVILRSDLPEPEADTYYWVDIIGLAVYDLEGGSIGRVRSILPTGGNDVYVVYSAETGEEILIPAIRSFIKDIDLDAGVMRVDLKDMPD